MADFTPVAAQIQVPQSSFNPLQTAEGAMALQGGMLRNRLLGLNLQGQQAIGQIIGANTDPATGETDWQRVSADASQNPAAAILMPQVQQQVLARQMAQVQLQREQLGLTGDQWGKVGATAMELLGRRDADGKPVQLSRQDVSDTMANDLIGSGMFSDPNAVKRLTGFLTGLPEDDTGIRQRLKGVAIMSSPTPERIAEVNGAVQSTDTGAQIQQQQVSPLTGEVTPVQTLTKTLTPSEKAARVGTVNQTTGVPESVPVGAVTSDTGAPQQVAGLTGPGGSLPTGLGPGRAEAMAAPVAARGQRAAEIEQSFAGSRMRQSQLEELAATLGDFRSGPGAAKWSGIVTEANRLFGTHYDDSQASAQQVFEKIASQVAAAQRDTMGSASTNAQTELAQLASPGSVKSPEANQQVIGLLRGNEDWIQAKAKAWKAAQKAGVTPDQLDDFEQQFSKLYDPRYFQEKYMTANQRGAMAREMGPKAYQAFEKQRKEVLGYAGIQ